MKTNLKKILSKQHGVTQKQIIPLEATYVDDSFDRILYCVNLISINIYFKADVSLFHGVVANITFLEVE